MHQLPYNNSSHVTNSPLELVHTDVWGPARTSVGGFKYYVSFLDDFSRFTWIYLIKRKSDVENIFYVFQNHVERLLNAKVHSVQFDWGGGVSIIVSMLIFSAPTLLIVCLVRIPPNKMV